MAWQAWLSVFVVFSVLGTLCCTKLSPALVIMAGVLSLAVAGVIDEKILASSFGNAGLITVAAMFVVAAGIQASGVADNVLQRTLRGRGGVRLTVFAISAPVIAVSAFINNTPIVATLIPVLNRWCRQRQISPSKVMMPLSYAAILGGTITLIGTSTNLVVNGLYTELTGRAGYGLFSITPIGIPVALAGLVFVVWVLPRWLPERRAIADRFANRKQFTFEVAVAADGPIVGKSIVAAGLRHLQRIFLVEIERDGRLHTAVAPDEILQANDRLVFVGDTSAITDVLRIKGLVASEQTEAVMDRDALQRLLLEVVVSPRCSSIGETLRDSQFRARYGAVVLAVTRGGEPVKGNLGSIELHAGDTLLLEALPDFMLRQADSNEFLLISDTGAERPRHDKAVLATTILLAVVILAAGGILSMMLAALLGAAVIVVTGCLSLSEALRSLDLEVLITIAASLALGAAIDHSGAAGVAAAQVMQWLGGNPLLLLVGIYVMVSIATEIITNTAAAVLMLPLVLAACDQAGLNHTPFVMAIMMAASASFATPIGYQTNLMVMGPGGYQFGDFLRIGVLMNVLVAVVTLTLIPLIWPLQLN